ncbi:hypothetical protein C8J56DRAFT_826958 [Mycena floridula]|nr:hypothetical protein C8J56DRAFT_826958 [Mycena floridula]
MLLRFLLAILPLLVKAQDGGITGAQTSADAAGYSCDSSQCKLPNCNCASLTPPGGLKPTDVPQFIVFTADDAIQSYTLDAINQFLAHRQNPNGCTPKTTYFTSLAFTNYTLVTDWYVAGNEIADHTMTHEGDPSSDEINGNLIALNALAGIPLNALIGFRAPFLNFSVNTLKMLASAGFTYDSTATASIPVSDPGSDAFWPYTLDNGMANSCLAVEGLCKGEPKLPGFWEIPMYAFFDARGGEGTHLMDPWLDNANGNSQINDTATLEYMKSTFTAHYNGNRAPIGLYTHPIHLSTTYPGVNPSPSTISMINAFLDWAQQQQDVWIVSNEQLLAYVKNPVPIANLDSISALKCSSPQVDPTLKICNGVPQNEAGQLSHCAFSDFPFYTCYGCPQTTPSPDDPNPAQQVDDGQSARFRLPSNCSTPFWDPVAGKCICTASTCNFADNSRPIGPNGANLTGGGTGGEFGSSPTVTYVPFNGAAVPQIPIPSGVLHAVAIAILGVILGSYGVLRRV